MNMTFFDWKFYSVCMAVSARAVLCLFIGFVFLVVPSLSFAKDYNYGCRTRNPKYSPSQKELGEYVKELEYIFEGKPIRRDNTVMGFQVTTFDVRRMYKGERPENDKLSLVHLKESFTDMEGSYLVRAHLERDNNLYPDPLACPKYYTDEEVISHIQFFWQRFIFGFFLLLFGVFACMKYLRYNKRFREHPYLKWFTK